MIRIKKGLDLPISGKPKNTIETLSSPSRTIAVVGSDFVGLKPTMKVQVGDKVQAGQVLFEDKKIPGVFFTSPCSGEVKEVNRGERRVFESIVITNEGKDSSVKFEAHQNKEAINYTREEVKKLLLESGEWVGLRSRPFEKSADPEIKPSAVFITAVDTNPLAPDVNAILADGNNSEYFFEGVEALAKLTDGSLYVCAAENFNFDKTGADNVKHEVFAGKHPAGNPGTHIHFLDPVSANKTVWHIGYQNVIAIGHLIKTGKLFLDRYISVAGPVVKKPRILKVRKGTEISSILQSEVEPSGNVRFISGSVFNGRVSKGPFDYLGHFHNQVTVLEEGGEREFLGWQKPGLNKFSVTCAFVSSIFKKSSYDFDTSLHGSKRAIVPIGSYEKVMPLDILPTFLLRSLMARDTDKAQKLGCLELAEEDLALCTYVDPGKEDFGPVLRENLDKIEKDG